jgi:SsrA-binding protein
MKKPKSPPKARLIASNAKAYYDFHIEEKIEAGIVLHGAEAKSLRCHGARLTGGYAIAADGQCWLVDVYIKPYEMATVGVTLEECRKRRLLLQKREIKKLELKVSRSGYTLVPLEMYFKDRWVKVLLGLARGKTRGDKRAALKEREVKRELDQAARRR